MDLVISLDKFSNCGRSLIFPEFASLIAGLAQLRLLENSMASFFMRAIYNVYGLISASAQIGESFSISCEKARLTFANVETSKIVVFRLSF